MAAARRAGSHDDSAAMRKNTAVIALNVNVSVGATPIMPGGIGGSGVQTRLVGQMRSSATGVPSAMS